MPKLLNTNSIWIVAFIAPILTQLLASNYFDPYFLDISLRMGINIILAVSLNLVNGFTGQFSLGHSGFMAIGAYSCAYMSVNLIKIFSEFLPSPLFVSFLFFFSLVFGGLIAALLGLLVSGPSLRLKGDYLAVVTLGFAEIVRVVLLNADFLGGARGFVGIQKLSNLAWIYTAVVLCVFVVYRLTRSNYGRRLLAIREDRIAAQAVGVNPTRAKVLAFVVSAFFAGIGGGLFAHHLVVLTPTTFDITQGFEIVTMVVLGGIGSISGSVISAIFITGSKEALRSLVGTDLRMVVFALILIILMLARPRGLLGKREFFELNWFKTSLRKP